MTEHDHEAVLGKVREMLPSDGRICDLALLFKLFGDPTRMKILFSLYESELCVCALTELLGMTQSAVSHQLRPLREANLVTARREGKTVFYSLADDHVRSMVEQGFRHLIEREDEA